MAQHTVWVTVSIRLEKGQFKRQDRVTAVQGDRFNRPPNRGRSGCV